MAISRERKREQFDSGGAAANSRHYRFATRIPERVLCGPWNPRLLRSSLSGGVGMLQALTAGRILWQVLVLALPFLGEVDFRERTVCAGKVYGAASKVMGNGKQYR